MIGLQTTRCVVQASLVSDFAPFIQHEEGGLTRHYDVRLSCVPIQVSHHVLRLLADVAHPVWCDFTFLTCVLLIFYFVLLGSDLKALEVVTLYFEVRILNHYAVPRLEVDHAARQQEVRQLNLKNYRVLPDKE